MDHLCPPIPNLPMFWKHGPSSSCWSYKTEVTTSRLQPLVRRLRRIYQKSEITGESLVISLFLRPKRCRHRTQHAHPRSPSGRGPPSLFFHHVIHLSHTETPTERPPAAAARRRVTCQINDIGVLFVYYLVSWDYSKVLTIWLFNIQ